jgi:hypothetical protein
LTINPCWFRVAAVWDAGRIGRQREFGADCRSFGKPVPKLRPQL